MALNEEEGLVAQAIAADVELSKRAQRIAKRLLDRVEEIVLTGNDQNVLVMASKIMPGLLKAIGQTNSDDAARAFEEMRREMREYRYSAAEQPADVLEDVVPDAVLATHALATHALKPPEIRLSTGAMRDRDKPAKKSGVKRTPST